MSLEKLEKDIQSHDSKAVKREHNKTVYNEWQSKEVEEKASNWQQFVDKMQGTRIKAIVVGGIFITLIVVALLATASFVFYQGGFFSQDRVSLSMEAPQTAESNRITEIAFYYENDNRASLEGSEIVVRFGDYFVPEENQENFTRVSASQGVIAVGSIRGGKKGEAVLAGHFVGPRDSVADIAGTLRYTPEDASMRYSVGARTSTVIMSSPISIDIESPQEIVSGNLLDVVVKVQNASADQLSNLKLVIDTPESFSLYNTEPRASHGTMWLIDQIGPQEEKVFHIRGGLDAAIGSVQTFDVEVGTQESGSAYVTYADAMYTPRIVRSPILVDQEVRTANEGVAYAGENVHYSVTFTNDSNVSLRDAVVTLNLEGDAIDFSTLQLDKRGNYDQENRRIVWKAADVPELRILEPQDSGKVSFSFTVKSQLPVSTENDHHFSITSVAAIDSEDIPTQLRENKTVLSNVHSLPIGAKVILGSVSDHESGVKPPKVGEKTIYNIEMSIDSINNDISDAIVYIPLPTHTTFEGSESDEIEYNDRTNDVTWSVGDVQHGAGVTSDQKKVSFKVGIVPSIDQVEKSPILIKDQTLSAKDVFTGLDVEVESDAKNTSSDGRFGGEGNVQQ